MRISPNRPGKWSRLYLYIPLLALILVWRSCIKQQDSSVFTLNLDQNWTFRAEGDSVSRPAVVPGTVHLDLMRQGMIPDPFWRGNEDSVQWVGSTDWQYECTFELDGKDKAYDQMRLIFEGLDTYAMVTLNDYLVLQADNMFRTWTVDVKEFLRVGPNKLRVFFRNSAAEDSVKAAEWGIQMPENRVFTRKAPYQSGWDWGPTLVTAGVWRPVRLEGWSGPRFESMQVIQHSLNNETARLKVKLTVNSTLASSAEFTIGAEGTDDEISFSHDLTAGKQLVEAEIEIPHPRRWWPHDQGVPHLYKIGARLKSQNGKKDVIKKRIGLRTVEVVQEDDEKGRSFAVHVNGRPVFMKGANVIPMDSFTPRKTADDYNTLVATAKDANMNMLRIWGGGIYPPDAFYDACDEAGVMVWQDFMFACAMYPGDDAFRESVRHEAVDNIKRLRHHPSLALWCGNNEVDEAFHNWGWQTSLKWSPSQEKQIWKAYEDVFHTDLPAAVAEHHPGAFYWPSSPKIGWGHAEAFTRGDAHYWGVWWGREPFSMYEKKVGRFMTEYGFEGMPSMATVRSFTDESDRYLGSPVMKMHQKHPFGDENIAEYMARDFKVPTKFEDYIYVSQCLQAQGIGVALEAHRRAKPYCMGTLYWQLNDCWPVTSWSSVEYSGRWKALHYMARRLFVPTAILHQRDDKQLTLFVNNDSPEALSGQLALTLMDLDGKALEHDTLDVEVEAGGNVQVWQQGLAELGDADALKNCVLSVSFESNGKTVAERLIHLARPKDQLLKPGGVSWTSGHDEAGDFISLEAAHVLRYVYLEAGDVRFSDNYFDMIPGRSKIVRIIGNGPEDIASLLTVRHLADIQSIEGEVK